MSAKTKIVVLRMKEIIYTAIFVGLAIFLITLCFIMFRPKSGPASSSSGTAIYVPGVYSAALTLGSEQVNVEVAVDSDRINSIALIPLSEAVTTMYPLMQPAMDTLSEQIVKNQSTKNISYSDETRYTSTVLLKAVDKALSKAEAAK